MKIIPIVNRYQFKCIFEINSLIVWSRCTHVKYVNYSQIANSDESLGLLQYKPFSRYKSAGDKRYRFDHKMFNNNTHTRRPYTSKMWHLQILCPAPNSRPPKSTLSTFRPRNVLVSPKYMHWTISKIVHTKRSGTCKNYSFVKKSRWICVDIV